MKNLAALVVTFLFAICFSGNANAQQSCRDLFSNETIEFSLLPQQKTEAIEAEALAVIKTAVNAIHNAKSIAQTSDATINQISDWANALPTEANPFRNLSTREHISLSYLLRSGFLVDFPDAQILKSIKSTLALSWTQKTGMKPSEDLLTERLPKIILAESIRDDQILHAASYQITDPATGRAPYAFGKDYLPRAKDFFMATGLVAFSFTSTGRNIIGSAAIGYAVATVAEYGMHRHIGHASKKLSNLFDKGGWLGRKIKNTFLAHALIHHRFARADYKKSAQPTESQLEKVSPLFEKNPGLEEKAETTAYGTSFNNVSLVSVAIATLPIATTLSMALGMGSAAIIAAITPTLLIGGASKIIHPYLHLSKEDALAQSSGFLKWLLQTRYAEVISALHYVHHNGGVGANYNLTPGGDYAARLLAQTFNFKNSLDVLTKPSLKMVLDMGELGLIGGVR